MGHGVRGGAVWREAIPGRMWCRAARCLVVGRGVCGTAAATRETQRVDDVHAFPGHIACDADSRSELVVPLVRDGAVLGVLDLDSPVAARFDAEDAAGCEALAALLVSRI